ncbi:Hypothetical predicted protein [Olea europaea subsp. europaea]|uniref:Uncharacterized protein n=1 Tax=Olea europaea subsp. europaea TaxID=158383 RepID=A0A8S0VEF4_OLEEU|nr:Hypothetical predicted protein [Olea europaea subsp. europaea]
MLDESESESESEEAIPYTVASDEVKPKDNNSLSTSIPLSSRNTDVERIILSEEHYALFEVNISELINNPSSYFNFCQRLFEVSGGKITEEGLQLMAASQRHQLCVILGTTNTWNEDTPTIYSAIQVYIEGRIAGVPYVNDGLPDYYLESTYDANWRVNPFLVGANILNIYTLLGEANDCIAVKLLSRREVDEAKSKPICSLEDEEEAEEGHKHNELYGEDDNPDDGVDDVEAREIQIWESQKRSQTPRLEAGGEATKVEKTAPSRLQIQREEPQPPEKRCWEGDTNVDPPKSRCRR